MKYKNLSNIFEGESDSDGDIKTNKEYAKNYDVWRKKEELNKYSTSSSEDDEEGVELTEQIEKDFFKTLACLKNKDPRIYDENVKFFDDKDDEAILRKDKKKQKDIPIYLKDYERNIILEKGGVLSDEEDEIGNPLKLDKLLSPTYVEEQNRIKQSFKSALNAVSDEEDDENWGGIFKERKKTVEETEKEDADYKKWLSGQKKKIEDKQVETELSPLKEYWNKPDLDEGEKFLRDYILNKKFLDKDEEDYIPTYDEIIHDSDQDLSLDEETIEKQEEFEHKYNFRFEEPDQEFVSKLNKL
ncbi:hypothetical protein NQ314_017332 [Rhamnusium bicolor]|uniref:Protein KRI1 homolog n=1 Tax=Rhamnusium bicolor TaxID=1586634 RepID=A0AAV8WTT4_9CUCU|nr:hypothetical protein NQ314_017332 [Rhamnusium bicolor]